MAQDFVLVGRIGAAHGVRGEVRLVSFMTDPAAIGRHGALIDASGLRTFEIDSLRSVKGNVFVARLKGVSSRTAAEALVNVDLYLARKNLPAPGADEFYYADLIGLSVEDLSGREIGRVLNVLDFGGGDILQVILLDRSELLLPFTHKTVPVVDIVGGRLMIDPPSDGDGEPRPHEHLG